MRTLSIDIETYSSVSLQKCGVYAYAESPDFEILLFGYAWDDEPAQVIDLTTGVGLPQELQNALYDPEILKTAYNANFERACLSAYMGSVTPPEQWQCTAVLSRELGLPASLEAVGEVIGLPEEKQKLKTGKALIRYFSIPCKPTKSNGMRTRNLPAHDPEKWALYIDYNRQDVETEREIRKRLSRFHVIETEQPLWEVDQRINDRGVGVDVTFAKRAIEIDGVIKARLLDQAKELTGLENPKSTSQLKGWIEDTAGIEVASLNKKEISGVRESADNEDVNQMLDIRAALAKTSTEKYNAMIRTVCEDGRIRGLTMFYGATRTGRWAGRLVQMQNLPQNKMPERDLDTARQLVRAGDMETLEMLYDDISGTLSQLIRTAFIPKKGHRFIVADFSAIEARVLAWLADEQWRLDVFNTHGKIYEASAEQMFHLPPGSVKKGDPMRQKGKIAELALGYGGSVGAMKSMGALEMGLQESELKPIVNSWRAANKSITKFWWDTDAAARTTINMQVPSYLPHNMGFRKKGSLLRLRLPSGRELSYVKPMVINDSITYGKLPQRLEVVTETKTNVVQGITHEKFETVLQLVACNIPVFLTGPAGCGKNVLCKQVSEALGLEFYFSNAVTQEYKLTGFIDANGHYQETQFHKAFTEGGLFMLDEIDASTPEVLVILNAAIANGYFDFPTGRAEAHKDFRLIAAGNTFGTGADIEYTGRYQLDAASLNRFAVIQIDYSKAVEEAIAGGNKNLLQFIWSFREAVEKAQIKFVVSYRAIERLHKLEDVLEAGEALQICLLRSLDLDDMKVICRNMNLPSSNAYADAFKRMVA